MQTHEATLFQEAKRSCPSRGEGTGTGVSEKQKPPTRFGCPLFPNFVTSVSRDLLMMPEHLLSFFRRPE